MSNTLNSPIPLVLQIGFAGARELVDMTAFPHANPESFSQAAEQALFDLLKGLAAELSLGTAKVFYCGISQLAVGADLAFAAALERHNSLQRVFLPQSLDGYLKAAGSRGADFTPQQQAQVRARLAKPNIIQTRVVSDADDRHVRFDETNLEIARVSDLVICLQRKDQSGRKGGTQDLGDHARRRNRPVITLEIGVDANGQPVISRPNAESEQQALAKFQAPRLPKGLQHAAITPLEVSPLPTGEQYVAVLKAANSAAANKLRVWFKWAALFIVLGHILATVLAVVVMKVEHGISVMLGAELVLVGAGLLIHRQLHRSHALAGWAACRLAAEVGRSLQALQKLPVYLQHFFVLPFPVEFRPLLRTLSVLHLRDTAKADNASWGEERCAYVLNRLVDPEKKAQIPYHKNRIHEAKHWLRWAHVVFYTGSVGAFICTLGKLVLHHWELPEPSATIDVATGVLGPLAVLLPVIAVAALSLAGAFDQEAKQHTSEELLEFLQHQSALLRQAQSPGEVGRLVIETESRLLGETVSWYARRSYVGVA